MVSSDVTVLAFVSSDIEGEPIEEVFDFQRASNIVPGHSATNTNPNPNPNIVPGQSSTNPYPNPGIIPAEHEC